MIIHNIYNLTLKSLFHIFINYSIEYYILLIIIIIITIIIRNYNTSTNNNNGLLLGIKSIEHEHDLL